MFGRHGHRSILRMADEKCTFELGFNVEALVHDRRPSDALAGDADHVRVHQDDRVGNALQRLRKLDKQCIGRRL